MSSSSGSGQDQILKSNRGIKKMNSIDTSGYQGVIPSAMTTSVVGGVGGGVKNNNNNNTIEKGSLHLSLQQQQQLQLQQQLLSPGAASAGKEGAALKPPFVFEKAKWNNIPDCLIEFFNTVNSKVYEIESAQSAYRLKTDAALKQQNSTLSSCQRITDDLLAKINQNKLLAAQSVLDLRKYQDDKYLVLKIKIDDGNEKMSNSMSELNAANAAKNALIQNEMSSVLQEIQEVKLIREETAKFKSNIELLLQKNNAQSEYMQSIIEQSVDAALVRAKGGQKQEIERISEELRESSAAMSVKFEQQSDDLRNQIKDSKRQIAKVVKEFESNRSLIEDSIQDIHLIIGETKQNVSAMKSEFQLELEGVAVSVQDVKEESRKEMSKLIRDVNSVKLKVEQLDSGEEEEEEQEDQQSSSFVARDKQLLGIGGVVTAPDILKCSSENVEVVGGNPLIGARRDAADSMELKAKKAKRVSTVPMYQFNNSGDGIMVEESIQAGKAKSVVVVPLQSHQVFESTQVISNTFQNLQHQLSELNMKVDVISEGTIGIEKSIEMIAKQQEELVSGFAAVTANGSMRASSDEVRFAHVSQQQSKRSQKGAIVQQYQANQQQLAQQEVVLDDCENLAMRLFVKSANSSRPRSGIQANGVNMVNLNALSVVQQSQLQAISANNRYVSDSDVVSSSSSQLKGLVTISHRSGGVVGHGRNGGGGGTGAVDAFYSTLNDNNEVGKVGTCSVDVKSKKGQQQQQQQQQQQSSKSSKRRNSFHCSRKQFESPKKGVQLQQQQQQGLAISQNWGIAANNGFVSMMEQRPGSSQMSQGHRQSSYSVAQNIAKSLVVVPSTTGSHSDSPEKSLRNSKGVSKRPGLDIQLLKL